MMKRKIKEGVANLNQIAEDFKELLEENKYLKLIFYLYRGFGNFMLS